MKKIIVLLFLFQSFISFSQDGSSCSLRNLYKNNLSSPKELREFTKNEDLGQDAWYVLNRSAKSPDFEEHKIKALLLQLK